MKSVLVLLAVVLVANCQEQVLLPTTGNHGITKSWKEPSPPFVPEPQHDIRSSRLKAIERKRMERSSDVLQLMYRNMDKVAEIQDNLNKERRAHNSAKEAIYQQLRQLERNIGILQVITHNYQIGIAHLKEKQYELESRLDRIRTGPQQGPFIIHWNNTYTDEGHA